MKLPLVSPSDAECAFAIEENLFDLFRLMTTLPGSEIVESEALSYHHSFPINPMFNGVWNTSLRDGEVDSTIEQTLDWFKTRNVPFIFWWTSQRTQPENLPERLLAHGFGLSFAGAPGMVIDLDTLSDEVSTPDGFSIQKVTNQQMLEEWRDVFCETYEVPTAAGQSWVDATVGLGMTEAAWQFYIGYLGNQAVATNILFKSGGVAGLYGVGTLPSARGKGIGAAITLQPLVDARADGYHVGVLFATEMGYPVYKRIGFRDVECRIGRYIWRNG